MHSPDWNDLRYFLAVCRAGTLVGAGRSLQVKHSTVGRRIEALEAALGVSLFTRSPDGFVLTDAGNEIMPLAEEAERAVTAIERRVAGGDKRISGVVRVTTSETFSGFLMRRLPELELETLDPPWQQNTTVRGLEHLWARCNPSAATTAAS